MESSSSNGLRKGAWSGGEDSLLRQCIDKYGEGKWHQVPLRAGLNRCRKSCRLRWLNYLKPELKKGKFSYDEVDLLLRLHKLLGNSNGAMLTGWSLIAGRLPGRTANDVKNYWNTHLCKKYEKVSKTKMKKKNIFSSPPATTEVERPEVLKPRPRYLSVDNGKGLPEVDVIPTCLGLDNVNVCENNITSENFEPVFNLTDEDHMRLDSLFNESQEGNAQIGPAATSTNEEATLMFDDFEQLWSLFHGELWNQISVSDPLFEYTHISSDDLVFS